MSIPMSDSGARWLGSASFMRFAEGFPWPQTFAAGFLWTSIATAMQASCFERPRLRASPYPWERSVPLTHVSSI